GTSNPIRHIRSPRQSFIERPGLVSAFSKSLIAAPCSLAVASTPIVNDLTVYPALLRGHETSRTRTALATGASTVSRSDSASGSCRAPYGGSYGARALSRPLGAAS